MSSRPSQMKVPIDALPGVAFAWKAFQNQSFGIVDESPVERRLQWLAVAGVEL